MQSRFALIILSTAVVVAVVLMIRQQPPRPAAPHDLPKQPGEPAPPDEAKRPLTLPLAEPKIVVMKARRQLLLYSKDEIVRRYPIGLGFNPVDDKVKEGDGCTPEGTFYIFTRNPKSAYYLSLGISYPDVPHAERGLRSGLIGRREYDAIAQANEKRLAPPQNTALGGQIYLHGRGSQRDWTWGCVALDDDNMKELFDAVPVGTPVIIEH